MPFRNLLKTAPPEAVKSLDELFAIASAMEREAATRYGQLAERMRAEGQADLAALFERLASEEQGHESSVAGWSEQRLSRAPDPAAIRWEIPETFDEETAADLASSRLINAYRVLSMAVRNEERAFTLWSYIAAQAEAPEIQQAAERMAREELEHVALLRRARRAAYHVEREGRPQAPARSVGMLLIEAAHLEERLARQITSAAEGMTGSGAARMHELAAQTAQMADEVAALSEAREAEGGDAPDMAAAAERLVEIYLDIGELSRDEGTVARAQILARDAIARLGWLNNQVTAPV